VWPKASGLPGLCIVLQIHRQNNPYNNILYSLICPIFRSISRSVKYKLYNNVQYTIIILQYTIIILQNQEMHLVLWMQFYCIVVHQPVSATRVAIFRVVRTGM